MQTTRSSICPWTPGLPPHLRYVPQGTWACCRFFFDICKDSGQNELTGGGHCGTAGQGTTRDAPILYQSAGPRLLHFPAGASWEAADGGPTPRAPATTGEGSGWDFGHLANPGFSSHLGRETADGRLLFLSFKCMKIKFLKIYKRREWLAGFHAGAQVDEGDLEGRRAEL